MNCVSLFECRQCRRAVCVRDNYCHRAVDDNADRRFLAGHLTVKLDGILMKEEHRRLLGLERSPILLPR